MDHSSFTGLPTEGVELLGMELLGIELLEDHARRLAALLSLVDARVAAAGRTRPARRPRRALREVYTELADDAQARRAASPAAEWLLDNFHIISAAARDIHHDLPPSFFRRLPTIATDEFAGLPRIYALARRADPLQRGPSRRAAAAPLHHRVPVGDAAHDRRAVGLAERAQARAGRASARPRGHPGREPRPAHERRPAGRRRSKPALDIGRVACGGASGIRDAAAAALAGIRRGRRRAAATTGCGPGARAARRLRTPSALKASIRRPSRRRWRT